jgi:C_GCAxxG_C_C family probable redox protein
MANLSRMGHCAPTVMRTLLELGGAREPDGRIAMAAGLPGGIGDTGGECGAVTASVLLLGLRHGLRATDDGLPRVVCEGQDLCARFADTHGTLLCREIRRDRRLPTRCVRVIRRAPELYAATVSEDRAPAVVGERRDAWRRLHRHLVDARFHCAHAVLARPASGAPASQELLDATAGFMGGTVLAGLTCSALTAGVIALGSRMGAIEDSRARVLRMIALMIAGGDALADEVNAFNPVVNRGRELARWFAERFGGTQCRDLTGCDFSSMTGVTRYIEERRVERCRAIAAAVAERIATVTPGSAADRRSS